MLLPGMAWSALFLRGSDIGIVGRIAIAIGLSIVIMPLTAFFLNDWFGVALSARNTVLIGSVLTAIPLVYILARRRPPVDPESERQSGLPIRLGTVHRAEIMKLLGIFNLKGNTVMDVGAFDGYVCSNMKGFTNRISMDPSLPDSSQSKGVQHVRAVGQALPVGSNSADVILCLDVLEHVDKEKPFLREVLRVLSETGRCYLTVPSKDISVFPSVLQGWVNKRWDHTLRSGYTVEEVTGLIHECDGQVYRTIELGTPLFRLFYFPLSLLWRISPQGGKALLVLLERFDLRFRKIGSSHGYLFFELGRRKNA
jgi:SAM-dependent methyltransferase